MKSGWRYRVASVVGLAGLTAAAVAVANHPATQKQLGLVPVVGSLPPTVLTEQRFFIALVTTLLIMLFALGPLFKPRPRRILDTVLLAQKRVVLGLLGLAAIGYFDYTYRLPRATLLVVGVLLFVATPLWSVVIRRPPTDVSRAVLVGDDPTEMEATLKLTSLPVIGYVSPEGNTSPVQQEPRADGGVEVSATATDEERPRRLRDLASLGGLSRLQEIVVEYDVDTALLAFKRPDRAEFFGTLDICYRHGVTALVRSEHSDSVLTSSVEQQLAKIDLEPWDFQERLAKRMFDVLFATFALVLLSPVMLCLAVAIKLDSDGPLLYGQDRTAEFGETFRIYKFRSMVPEAEAESGPKLSEEDAGGVDPRVTRVGHVLRKTHLDEIPQLWSILKGDMSVVGPRPERPELDADIEQDLGGWSRRWFVKPGLTGLAQINDVTGHEPARKLRYDIEYIRRQSFWFDLKVVVRQFWLVGEDVVAFLRSSDDEEMDRL